MNSRSTGFLASIALVSLLAGALVYVAGRPAGTAYLLPEILETDLHWPWLGGRVGLSLPSFLHAFAFSLLTALCLAPWHYAAGAACAFWLVVDAAFEIAQAESIAGKLVSRLPAFFADWPLLDHVDDYLLAGEWDPLDLLFTALGCGLAYLLLRRRPAA